MTSLQHLFSFYIFLSSYGIANSYRSPGIIERKWFTFESATERKNNEFHAF